MNDPHVVALHYRINHGPTIDYSEAETPDREESRFRLTVEATSALGCIQSAQVQQKHDAPTGITESRPCILQPRLDPETKSVRVKNLGGGGGGGHGDHQPFLRGLPSARSQTLSLPYCLGRRQVDAPRRALSGSRDVIPSMHPSATHRQNVQLLEEHAMSTVEAASSEAGLTRMRASDLLVQALENEGRRIRLRRARRRKPRFSRFPAHVQHRADIDPP